MVLFELVWAGEEKPIDTPPTLIALLTFPVSQERTDLPPVVRYGFEFDQTGWRVRQEKIPDITWSVTLNGKDTGQIQTNKTREKVFGSEKSLRVITALNDIRTFPNPSLHEGESFATWMGIDRFRPMVLVNHKKAKDPEQWKPDTETVQAAHLVKETFKKTTQTYDICDKETFKRIEKKAVENADLKIVKTYRNQEGHFLMGVVLSAPYHCDAIMPETFFIHWYFVQDNEAQLIGNEVTPLDAADYNGDGISEWIFQIQSYNSDGYALFSPQTKKILTFTWQYH